MTDDEREELVELRDTVEALQAQLIVAQQHPSPARRPSVLRAVFVGGVLLVALGMTAIAFTPFGAALIAVIARCSWWLVVNVGPTVWRIVNNE